MFDGFLFKGENFSKLTQELVEMNKKMEAVQKNVAAVIAKELQPHLRKSNIQSTPVVVLSADSQNISSNSSANEECCDTLLPSNNISSCLR